MPNGKKANGNGKNGDTLAPRQQRFAQEYVVDLNGTQAAIRAGYSPKGADVQANRLLGNAKIKAEVRRLQDERARRTQITADRVLQELAAIGFSDIRHLYDDRGRLRPMKEWPDDVAAAVAGFETVTRNLDSGDGHVDEILKVKRWDKPKTLEMMAKHLGLFEKDNAWVGVLEVKWKGE